MQPCNFTGNLSLGHNNDSASNHDLSGGEIEGKEIMKIETKLLVPSMVKDQRYQIRQNDYTSVDGFLMQPFITVNTFALKTSADPFFLSCSLSPSFRHSNR